MPRNHVPKYRFHRQSTQAIVTLTDSATGQRRDFLLGPLDGKESRAEYYRLIAEWEANGRRLPGNHVDYDLTINELILSFMPHVRTHYRRPDGTPTSEIGEFRLALRPLKHLYGDTQAAEFGPLRFKAVRQFMIDGYSHSEFGVQKPIARTVINQRMGRIRRRGGQLLHADLQPFSQQCHRFRKQTPVPLSKPSLRMTWVAGARGGCCSFGVLFLG